MSLMDGADVKNNIHFYRYLFEPGENADQLQQKLVELFPAVVFLYDFRTASFRFLNHKMTDLLGYSPDEIEKHGNDFLHFVCREDVEGVKASIEKCRLSADGETCTFDCRLPHLQGRQMHFRTNGTVLQRNEKGEAAVLLFIAHDITERVVSEKGNLDLLHYKDMIREKENFLGYGSWESELLNGTISWSEGMYELFGYDAEKDRNALQITEALFSSHMSPEQRQEAIQHRKEIMEGNQPDYTWEFDIITKQNTSKRIQSYAKVIRNEKGVPIKIYGISRDITFLRQYENSLEAKIQELKRSNKELEEFAYIASHDLQEPLRKLTTFSERLQQKFAGKIDSEGETYLTRMMNAAHNMRILIDNLLEYSRTTTHAKVFMDTNLNELLKKVTGDLELVIEETKTELTIQDLPTLEVIPGQICQLFNNLLSNAIKFRQAGKTPAITISSQLLSQKEKEQHQLYDNKNYYQITVKDNGIGFEAEYAERIFQIFQRLHGKSEYPGSGIGLSICKKIVENHSGQIHAHSIPGQGSSFVIILPEKQ